MFYWELVSDFVSACKLVKFLTYEEYTEFAYKRLDFDYQDEKVKLMWAAVRHYSNLVKLDLVSRGIYGHPPKIERAHYGKGFVEYWYADPKRNNKRKKICGYPKKGVPVGWVCLRLAGQSTAHPGYGYCMTHEMIEAPEGRTAIWLRIREIHGKVKSLKEVVKQAEEIDRVAGKTIDADIAYLEIARQTIMMKAGEAGTFTREMTQDLSFISEASAKVKALKSKIDHITDIPVGQVGALIVQVLNAVTQGESVEVKNRIAARARELSSVLVPRLDTGRELTGPIRTKEMEEAIKVSAKYAGTEKWGDIREVSGYEIETPEPQAVVKKIPNYKINHPRIKHPPSNGDGK